MKTKYTPGPWIVQKSDHSGGLLIKPLPGQVVAQCDDIPEMKANAALISAAPELLEALKILMDCSTVSNTDMKRQQATFKASFAVMNRVCAAIAKAKGRAA